ncbi:MAG: serine hydrolase [Planctomycetota bacterium]
MTIFRAVSVAFLFIIFSGTTSVFAQQPICPAPEFVTRADIRGIGLAEVTRDDIDVSVYGYAEYPIACVTEDTVFEAASLTKPVVAYLVMRLVDQGRLGLDDSLIELLPSLPLPEGDPRSGRVTIRMALAHSTGLEGPDNAELRFVSEPGETFSYYPAGYRLVQRIIEDLEGDTLEAIAQREVFVPLGMTSSSLVFREDLLPRIATRHRILGDAFQRDRDPEQPANAAASMVTSTGDYGRFLNAMLGGDGLTDLSRDAMLTPQIDVPETDGAVAWGIGWGLEPARGTFWHYGDDGAAKCFTIGSTEQGRAIVYFTGSTSGLSIAGEMAERLIPGESPAVEWLGYDEWDAPRRLARRDTLRAFVEGDDELGMQTLIGYGERNPDLDLDNLARYLTWVLDNRGVHEGRARLLAWRIERAPDNVDLYLDRARSLKEMGDFEAAIQTLRDAQTLADENLSSVVAAQLAWLVDEAEAARNAGSEPEHASSALEGTYGTWRVFTEDGALLFQPGQGNRYSLRWMLGTTYALEELDWFRLRFVIDGGVATKVIGMYSDGRTAENERVSEPD